MNIWFTAAEAAPFFKAGGLADVAGALPKVLEKEGVQVKVILPFYAAMPDFYKEHLTHVLDFNVKVGWRNQHCSVKVLHKDGVEYLFLENDFYFGRPDLYGYEDDGERFAFFSQAVIELMIHSDDYPEIIHCNDWHTAMIPVLLRYKYKALEKIQAIKTVLTIHNLLFQGVFDLSILSDWYGMEKDSYPLKELEFYGKVNVLKGGIYCTDLLTTVSPTYAKEIMTPEFGYGLETVLQDNAYKVRGILNGLDIEEYNPETNSALSYPYSVKTLEEKEKNKRFLQKKVGLKQDQSVCLLGVVSRLTSQKGLQLFQPILSQLVEKNIQLVVLGTGDLLYENQLREAEERYPDQLKSLITFDADLAQQIYAGADVFLMPSQFEPCGIAQMNAMHYGTIPIVHETGGLVDTVVPFNERTEKGTGFRFSGFTPEVFLNTIENAVAVFWNQKEKWHSLQVRAMEKDFSWTASANIYIEEYKKLLNK